MGWLEPSPEEAAVHRALAQTDERLAAVRRRKQAEAVVDHAYATEAELEQRRRDLWPEPEVEPGPPAAPK